MGNFRQNIKKAMSSLEEYEGFHSTLAFSERFIFALYFQKLRSNDKKQYIYYDSVTNTYESLDRKLKIQSHWEDVKETDLIYNGCHFTYVAKEKPYVEVSITSLFKDKITASEKINDYIESAVKSIADIILLNEELNEKATENLLTQYNNPIDLILLSLLLKEDAINMLCVKLMNSDKNLLKNMIEIDKDKITEFIEECNDNKLDDKLNKTQKETLITNINKLFIKKECVNKFTLMLNLKKDLLEKPLQTKKIKI